MTGLAVVTRGSGCGEGGSTKSPATTTREGRSVEEQEQNQLSVLAFILSALRKSMVSCRIDRSQDVISAVHHMEIGWPTNVQHITHVTFDRFNGFLGLPVEFEVEIPCKVPSASASVFGVSADSMQCSYDLKGNSVPIILLLMQERLYTQGGLKAEGIFRINPENSQEQRVRDQLNRGMVPDDIDVHCLAGLIKTWFRELPSGVLDGLSPEQVLQCNTEEDYIELVKQLKPTEAALLNWAIDLMADVVEEEYFNKMNARNIAMVFAPNMTQMSDPLTALMHAVQVINLLKTLITRTLREREDPGTGEYSPTSSHSSDQCTYEDYDSQQEEMNISCESRGPGSDCDDHANHSHNSEDELGPLSEIEECFLKQLAEFNNIPKGDLPEPTFSDANNCGPNHRASKEAARMGTELVANDRKGDPLSELDGHESMRDVDMGTELVANDRKGDPLSELDGHESMRDVDMVDNLAESPSPLPLLVLS